MQKRMSVKKMSAPEPFDTRNSMQNDAEAEALAAESQFDRATETLRTLVLRGAFPLDVKSPETRAAELIGVSRTPARLAMAALERDGLLVRLPRRGFRVRSFSLDEVVEAIEVRGELEAVAARVTSEKGLSAEHRLLLEASITQSDALLKTGSID